MTKQEAMEELKRAADICPTTPLAEACRYAVAIMCGNAGCNNCKHGYGEKCRYCDELQEWEPKEG